MSTTSTTPSIFPPPFTFQPTSTPRDDASNSSSSSGRRKRTFGESIAPSTASSDFSSAVKRRIQMRPGSSTCWNCNASPTQICHVISKSDSAFAQMHAEGLITFNSLGLVDNAIALCPLCHVNFDDISFPGLVFLPTDLHFFIEYEQHDFEERTKALREMGQHRTRRCPTAVEYEENQKDKGALTGGADLGGLYHRYVLRDYLPSYMPDKEWIPGRWPHQNPKQWAGAPMAAIRRGLQALAYPKRLLPERETTQLRELQDLYSRELPIAFPEQPSRKNVTDLNTTSGTHDTPHEPHISTPSSHPTTQTRSPRQAAWQQRAPEPGEGEVQGGNSDSAIDVRSRGMRDDERDWSRTEQQHKMSEKASNLKPFEVTAEASKHRRRKRKQQSSAEDWVQWGPSSSSKDKIDGYARRRRLFDDVFAAESEDDRSRRLPKSFCQKSPTH